MAGPGRGGPARGGEATRRPLAAAAPWYVRGALAESRRGRSEGAIAWPVGLLAGGALVLALAACGGGERGGAVEAAGDFPVEIVAADFPSRQRLAETIDLVLGIENAGSRTLPDLAVTVFVDEGTSGPFTIREDQPELADPNRPAWILESKYPRLAGDPVPSGVSDATTAEANTFAFGPLAPGQIAEIVWRLTPVRAGTYTLNYEIAAGLQGRAAASGETAGTFVATISTKPRKQRIDGQGRVVDVR